MDNSSIKDLLFRIRTEQDYSASQKCVAAYVSENYFLVPFLSISALAANIGVSDGTVVKFCNKLGFQHFKDFKNALAECAHSELVMANKLSGGGEREESLAHELEESTAALSATLKNEINADALRRLIPKLNAAAHIYVTGARSSSYLAGMLATMLRYLDLKVYDISQGYADQLDKISMIDRDDIVIAISLPRYTAGVVDTLRMLHERGVFVALITDTGLSPAYPYADVAFHCSVASSCYFPCTTGCLALLHAICRAVSESRQDAAAKHVRELEQRLINEKIFL